MYVEICRVDLDSSSVADADKDTDEEATCPLQ